MKGKFLKASLIFFLLFLTGSVAEFISYPSSKFPKYKITHLSDEILINNFAGLSPGYRKVEIDVESNLPLRLAGQEAYNRDLINRYDLENLRVTTQYEEKMDRWQESGEKPVKQIIEITNPTNLSQEVTLTLRSYISASKVTWNGKEYEIRKKPLRFNAYRRNWYGGKSIEAGHSYGGMQIVADNLEFSNPDEDYSGIYDWRDVSELQHEVRVYKRGEQAIMELVLQIPLKEEETFTIDPIYDLDKTKNFNLRYYYTGSWDVGGCVAIGDVNNDNRDDLIIGAPVYVISNTDGCAYVIFGQKVDDNTGSGNERNLLSGNNNYNLRFQGPSGWIDSTGWDLAVGDLDNDGVKDLVIGAYRGDLGPDGGDTGIVYVIPGENLAEYNENTLEQVIQMDTDSKVERRIYGRGNNNPDPDMLGMRVAVGDVNGDNKDDLIMGTNRVAPYEGYIFVVYNDTYVAYGATKDIFIRTSSNYNVRFNKTSPDGFGTNCIWVGDINGDGKGDLLMGANGDDYSGRTDSGVLYVVLSSSMPTGTGNNLNINSTYSVRYVGAATGENLGTDAVVADVNGDGSKDLIIGAHQADYSGRDGCGAVYVIDSSKIQTSGTVDLSNSSNYSWKFVGASGADLLGYHVEAGDINGDGKDDLIMGAHGADTQSRTNNGAVYIVYSTLLDGLSEGIVDLSNTNNFSVRYDGDQNSETLSYGQGAHGFATGDLNGDGKDDLTIGAQGGSNEYVYVLFKDTSPPAAITNLSALAGSSQGQIQLTWTAPGDDGTTGDCADSSYYTVKFATYSVSGSTETWWNSANTYSQNWSVSARGTLESKVLWPFTPQTTYYFAIKTTDDVGYTSAIDKNTQDGSATQAWAKAPGSGKVATWIGPAGGNWSTGANWSGTGGLAPGPGDDVVFNSTTNTNSTVDASFGGSIGSLRIDSGYTQTITLSRTLTITDDSGCIGDLTISDSSAAIACGSNLLTIEGNMTLNGTISGTGGVTMNGVAGKTIDGSGSVTNTGSFTISTGAKSFNATANLTFSGTIAISGAITVTNNGTVNANNTTNSITGSAAGSTWVNAANSTLNASGPVLSTGTLTANANPNTVNYNGGAHALKVTTYHHLTLSGSGAKTGAIATVNGNFTLQGTTTYTTEAALTIGGNLNIDASTFTVGAYNLTVTGATNISGTLAFNSTTGTKIFTGLITVNSGGTWSNNTINEAITCRGGISNNGTFNAGTGVYTFSTNNQNIWGTLAIPSITVTTITLYNRGTLTVSTALAGTGTLYQWTDSTLNVDFTGAMGITTLNASAGGNTVSYGFAGAQTIKTPASNIYWHLTLANSGAKSAGAGLTLEGNLTLSGSATFTTGSYTHTFKGNWTIDTSAATPITATGSTINFNTPTTPAATAINNGSTTATLALVTVNINNTSGFSCNEDMSASGTLTIASGVTFTPGAANIISGTGTLTGNGTVQVTRTAATPDFSSQYTITNKTLTNLTVEYVGAGNQTVSTVTYGHLKINDNGYIATLANDTTVNGNLTVTSGTLSTSASGYDLNVGGNWSNSGTFTAGTSTVTFVGTDQSILGSTTFYNFIKIESTNNSTDVTLTFDNTATQTINGLFMLDGLDDDDRINLRSDLDTNQWSLVCNGTFAIDYVDVKDSDASGGLTIQHTNTTNSGNNLNWGFLDTTPPAAITNLSALTGDNGGEVKLSWSAPGDDGWNNPISGGKYGVKWSTYTSFDWDGASNFDLEWTTSTSPGADETKVITGLTGGTTYYFRIWTRDEVPTNWSGISNAATAQAKTSGTPTPPGTWMVAGTVTTDGTGSNVWEPINPHGTVNYSYTLQQCLAESEDQAGGDYKATRFTSEPAQYMKLTNFGFNIPSNSIILGFTVEGIAHSHSAPATGRYHRMQLTKTNTEVTGTEKYPVAPPQNTDGTFYVGSESDLWGGEWTPAQVSSTNFGLWLKTDDFASCADQCWNRIRMKVDYSTYSASNTYDFTTGTGTTKWAYENVSGDFSTPSGGTEFTSAKYDAIKSNDSSRAATEGTTSNTIVAQRFLFQISESTSVITTLTAYWVGHSTDSSGGALAPTLSIWNFNSSQWDTLQTGTAQLSDQTLLGNTTNVSYCVQGSSVNVKVVAPNVTGKTTNLLSNYIKLIVYTIELGDTTAPAAITNLSALTGDNAGEIKLSWSAPGDDGWNNPISGGKYGIKYATYSSFDFNGPSGFNLEWSTNTTSGASETKIVQGLTSGTTYYFRIWTRDEVSTNWSGISNGATTWAKVGVGDTTKPGPVTNLIAKAKAQIELTWTAPGDDDYTGTATEYIIRYSTVAAITDDTGWSQASDLTGEPAPLVAGTTQVMTLINLKPGTTYYFAIKTKDEANNTSDLDTSSPEPAAKAGNLYLQQTIFSDTAGTEAKKCYFALGDYDNDGDLDIVYAGKGSGNAKLVLYRNDDGLFNTTPVQELMSGDGNGLSNNPCVEFGDIDNDGDLDLAAMGVDDNGNYRLIIYRNGGGSTPFTKLQEPLGATGGITLGNLAFADIDNDGDLDLAATGQDVSNNRRFIIFENNVSSFTIKQQPLGTSALTNSYLVFGDFDRDGDQDIFITGWDGGGGTYHAYVYDNSGGTFTSIKDWDKSVVGTEKCQAALGDYDLDGDLDLAIAGESWPNIRFRLYKYDGTNIFTSDQNPLGTDADVGGLGMGSIAFGDYDHDGDIDIAAIGYGWYDQTNWYKITRFALFKNTNGTYSLDQEPMGIKIYKDTTTVQGMSMGRVTFGDIDNDGDLDVVVGGNMDPSHPTASNQLMELRVYYNTEKDFNNNQNSAPSAPASLTGLYENQIMTLQWNPGSDPGEGYSTDDDMLYYNLRVGKVSGGNDIVSGAYGSPLLGNYLRPKISTTQLGVKLKNLEAKCTYYWNVQTIDSGLKQSSWSSQQSVYIPVSPLTLYYRTDNCSSPFPTTSDKLSTSAGTSSDVTTTAQTNTNTGNYYQLRPGINTSTYLTSLPSDVTQYGWIYDVDQTGYKIEQGSWTFKVGYYCTNATMASNLYYRVCKVTATASNVYKVATLRDWASQSLSGSTSLTYTNFQTWVDSTTFNAGEYIMAEFFINPTNGGGGGAPTRYWYFEVGTSSNYITTQNIGDFTPPGAITNLSALTGDENGNIDLSWTAPGDSGYVGDNSAGSKYILKYDTYSVAGDPTAWWNVADTYSQNWPVANQGTKENKTLTGLEPGTTYWFAIKTVDDNGNVSEIDTNATSSSTQAKAMAYTGPPLISKIVFTTSPQTISQNVASSTMTIQTQSSGGTPVNVNSDTAVTLESTSGGGKFSITSDFAVEVTTVTITNGTSTANFFYKDTQVGNPIITADELDGYGYGWDPAQQQQTITGTSPDLSVSSTTIVFSDDTPLPNEVITISATIKNDGGDYTSGYTVVFTSQPSNNNQKTTISDTVWIGQSFLTGSRQLLVNKVELYMQGQTGPGLTYVQIQTDNNNKPSGTKVGGRTGYVPIGTDKKWYEFTFGTKPLLQPTTKYWIVVKNESDVTSDLYHDTTQPYANGEEKKYSGGSWTSTNADTTFRLYVDYTVVQFYDGDPDSGGTQIGADQNFPPITQFSSTTASVNWTAVSGDRNIYATVDLKVASPGSISESNENNNKAFRTIHVDSSPPAGITTLSALIGDNIGEIKLSWSAPGDDGWTGNINGGKYGIKYATYPSFDFNGPSGFNLQWSTNTTPNASQAKVVTGLSPGTTYYFRIWTADEVLNWSGISNGATTWAQVIADSTTPSAITNLSALAEEDGDVKLSWSAPGDDGWDNPISDGKYGVKWSTYPSFDWDGASNFDLEWATSTSPGANETKVITGLTGGTTHYFRIWTADEASNWSDLSNGATVWVLPILSVSISTDTIDLGVVEPGSYYVAVSSLVLTNNGNIKQKFKLKIVSEPNGAWESVTATSPGAEQYRYSGVFRSTQPVSSDFSPEDSFSVSTERTSSATELARDSDPDDQKGFDVSPTNTRNLWFKFEAPTSTDISTTQAIPLRIIALPYP